MISQKASLHNRFDFEIYDTETGQTEYAQAENIVLNNMWLRLCGGSDFFNYIGIGTGSGTLSATRTTLFSHLAYKSAVNVETVYDTSITAHVTKKITFSESEANGTWTEVGILFGTTTGSNYVTHALITDSEGNPITVQKTNTKIITIYATVFATLVPATGGEYAWLGQTNHLLGVLLSGTSWPSVLAVYNQSLPPSGEKILGFPAGSVSISWSSDAANKRRYTNLARLAVGDGNKNLYAVALQNAYASFGVAAAELPISGVYEGHTFTGVAVGTGDGVTTEFDLPKSFPRPLSETIKINGAAKTRGADYQMRHGIKTGELWYEGQRPQYGERGGVIGLKQPADVGTDGVVAASCSYQNINVLTNPISIYASEDGLSWDTVVENNSPGYSETTYPMLAKKYKYLKWVGPASGNSDGKPIIKVVAAAPTQKHIKFTTPPASGAVITADFSVDYIPKSSNFVLDLQAEVVFGEGV